MTPRVTACAVLALVLGTAPAARAGIIFGNFGPGSTFNTAVTQYWVTVSDVSGGTDGNVWDRNGTGDTSAQAFSTDGGETWFSPPGSPAWAHQIDGTAIPESSAMALLSSGLLGLLGSRWRRPGRRERERRPPMKRPQAEQFEDRLVLTTTFNWTQVTSPAGGAGTMLQYPNGTIMMVGNVTNPTNSWVVGTPSNTGSYAGNIFAGGASYPLNIARKFYATNVLPSGKIYLLGGEYTGLNFANKNETNTGETFIGPDNGAAGTGWVPIGNFLTNYPKPKFGDDSSMLLNNGLILLGTGAEQGQPYNNNGLTYLFNPTSNPINAMINGSMETVNPGTYSAHGISTIGDYTDVEENWVKLPNGSVLTYDIERDDLNPSSTGYAQLFDPATGSWRDISPATGTANGSIPTLSLQYFPFTTTPWDELGPALLLPNGNVFIVGGGTPNTALYNPTTNTWSAGPMLPVPFTSDDAPGAVLPNGDVIFTADSAIANGPYEGPTAFFDYTPPANGVGPGTLTQLTGTNVPNDPGLANMQVGCFEDRFLVLPTGQLMFADAGSNQVWLGTPNGGPLPQWRPVVTKITGGGPGGVYTLTGQQLNGLDAGAAYGDDAEMDENYPIVRLMNAAGTVYYTTTSNWNNLGVATGNAMETVTFTLPPNVPAGNYSLVVSGAGVNSFPVALNVSYTNPLVSFISGVPGASVHSVQSPGPDGLGVPLDLQTSGTNGQITGLQPLPPSPTGPSDGELGVLPTAFTVPIGSASDDLFTPTGYAPVEFANTVDAVFAGEELSWLDDAALRGKKPGVQRPIL